MFNMIYWIILGIFILLATFLLKVEHMSKKAKLVIILVIGLIIYFSAFGVLSSSGVDLTTPRGVVHGLYMYVGWIGRSVSNLWDARRDITDLVGNAVKIDGNKTSEK